jgi:hypothetical protein
MSLPVVPKRRGVAQRTKRLLQGLVVTLLSLYAGLVLVNLGTGGYLARRRVARQQEYWRVPPASHRWRFLWYGCDVRISPGAPGMAGEHMRYLLDPSGLVILRTRGYVKYIDPVRGLRK